MGKIIMTVDDSASIRQMVSFTLKKEGHKTIEAVDGADTLPKLNGKSVHMITTDLNMPNLNGIGPIKSARINPSFRFIPIVTLSAESQESRKLEGKSAGATGWIIKPFRPAQLTAVVRKVLG